jgi:hypothetical protein
MYAPKRRAPQDDAQQTLIALEGEVRHLVPRNAPVSSQHSNDKPPISRPADDRLDPLIRAISVRAIDEIENVILELKGVREMLCNEGDRVNREIASYVSLSHAVRIAMNVIGESLTQWRTAPDKIDDVPAE